MKQLFLLVALGFLTPESLCQTSKIHGTWELMDVSSVPMMDCPPRGLCSRKDYYSRDGRLFIIAAQETLGEATVSASYSFSGGNRIVTLSDGTKMTTPVHFIGEDLMVLEFGENDKWTYKRLEGKDAYDRPIEPRSVLVVRMNDPKNQISNLDVNYDTNDYSNLDLANRVVGVWEVVAFKDVSPQNAPPYGFPNEKYVLTSDGDFFILSAQEQSLKNLIPESYSIEDQSVVVGSPPGKQTAPTPPLDGKIKQIVTFNGWGHMVWRSSDAEVHLKLLTKNCDSIPKLPLKIVLLSLKGG